MTCPKCISRDKAERMNIEMKKQDYTRPWKGLKHVQQDVYICPVCGYEIEYVPNDNDGYSVGAGLFNDE